MQNSVKKLMIIVVFICFCNTPEFGYSLLRLPNTVDIPIKDEVEDRIIHRLDLLPESNFDRQYGKRVEKKRVFFKAMSLEQFGAKGDGKTDDTKAIAKALNSSIPLIYVRKGKPYYKVSDKIVISGIRKMKLIATGATFLNSDLNKATFFFQGCSNIEVNGGNFGYVNMPKSNGDGSQHLFQFDGCQNVILDKVHVLSSPEMGIAITSSNKVTVKNSTIEHTFRDGTYSHYSANVSYLYNTYRNIKDDAMSFHDYGIDKERKALNKYGYKQATNLVAKGNTVENSYQGFGSIGSVNVSVLNNKFKNTVLAGISIFNAQEMSPGSDASAKKCLIQNNVVTNACATAVISGVSYANNGQASTGRAAICVLSLGEKNQLNQGETKRLSGVKVIGNTVNVSGANGFFANLVDNFYFTANKFTNCSGAVPTQSLNGDVIEIWNCTNLWADANTVLDTRKEILHQHGYAFNNVSGKMGSWNIKGVIRGEKVLEGTQSLRIANKQKSTKL